MFGRKALLVHLFITTLNIQTLELIFSTMGQELSHIHSPRDLKNYVEDKMDGWRNDGDPCKPQLQAYLKCVESHKDGLTEGDDCSKETVDYKACRTQHKDWKKKS
jgi:hypothetical protein